MFVVVVVVLDDVVVVNIKWIFVVVIVIDAALHWICTVLRFFLYF